MMMKRRNKILFTQNRQFYVLTCLGGFGKNIKINVLNLEIDLVSINFIHTTIKKLRQLFDM